MSVRPDPASFVKPADVWARAIIAAARVYGEDPVEALTSPSSHARSSRRKCLPAACLAISEATGLPICRVAPVLAQAVEALPTPEPEPAPEPVAARVLRPHAPLAGRVNLANGHAFAPPFRPGPPPPTQSMDGRILARLAVAPGSPRGLASILDIKEAFVAQTLRNLGREGRVTAADLAPGQSDRDQAWSVA